MYTYTGLPSNLLTPATEVSEHTQLTQDTIDALQKFIKGTELNVDATDHEEAQQLLALKICIEDARDLKTRLKESKLPNQHFYSIVYIRFEYLMSQGMSFFGLEC